MSEPKLWEVWSLEFKFEDNPQIAKMRPVIVAAKEQEQAEVIVLSIKVTSHPPRTEFPGEIPLLDWGQAGLSKPSTARCSKHLLVPIQSFEGMHRYGRLSKRDEETVRDALLMLELIA